MLKREGGTTLEEIMTAMGWLKHTTRAMLSAGGSLTKKHGLVVTSEKVGDKRVYSIKAEPTEDRSSPPPDSTPAAFFLLSSRIANLTLPVRAIRNSADQAAISNASIRASTSPTRLCRRRARSGLDRSIAAIIAPATQRMLLDSSNVARAGSGCVDLRGLGLQAFQPIASRLLMPGSCLCAWPARQFPQADRYHVTRSIPR